MKPSEVKKMLDCDHDIEKWNKSHTRCKCGFYIKLELDEKTQATVLRFTKEK